MGISRFSVPITVFSLLFAGLMLLNPGNGSGKEGRNSSDETADMLTLTAAESAWLKSHHTIHLGIDPKFAPFEFIDKKGRYAGMAADYIKILNKRLGIQMQIIPGLTWNEVVNKARKGEIDVLPCVGITEERKAYLLFSDPYIAFPRVIITKIDAPFIGGLADIADKKIAVQENSSHHGFLKGFPKIKPVLYKTAEAALLAVSQGKADANIGNAAAAAYLIQKNNLSNLKIAAPVSTELNSLHFAVRKDWPELVSILNKALASFSTEEEAAIRKKWTTVRYEHGIDVGFILKVAAQAGVVIFLVLGTILIWNRRLKREVLERIKAENNERLAREKAEQTAAELAKTLRELEETQDQLVQSEKLAALGQLIAGIAHEINTPLGAIESTVDTISSANTEVIQDLPAMLTDLPADMLALFFDMIGSSPDPDEKTTSLQRRKLIKQVTARMKEIGCECDKFSAETLVLLGHAETAERFRPLLEHPDKDSIFRVARRFYNLKNGTDIIALSSRKMGKIVFALKSFVQVDQKAEMQDGDLRVSIENVLVLYENQMRQGITLKTDLEDVGPVRCYIDELNQVWTNLVHNALQAMNNQGELTVSLKKIDALARVSIKDSGEGIPEDIQDKIFQPFFSTRKAGEGSGLGLDIVKKIVEKHNGTIEFVSVPGQGTEFIVSIPLND